VQKLGRLWTSREESVLLKRSRQAHVIHMPGKDTDDFDLGTQIDRGERG